MSIWNDILGFLSGVVTGDTQGAAVAAGSIVSDPLGIGAAIESGFVSFFKDVWKVIAGPVQILGGIILIILSVMLAFKNQIEEAASVTPQGAMASKAVG